AGEAARRRDGSIAQTATARRRRSGLPCSSSRRCDRRPAGLLGSYLSFSRLLPAGSGRSRDGASALVGIDPVEIGQTMIGMALGVGSAGAGPSRNQTLEHEEVDRLARAFRRLDHPLDQLDHAGGVAGPLLGEDLPAGVKVALVGGGKPEASPVPGIGL